MGKRTILHRTQTTSFDEAFDLNRLKIRQEVDDLNAGPPAKGDPRPGFWQGCHIANQIAIAKYDRLHKKLRAELARELACEGAGLGASEEIQQGFDETMKSIIRALDKDDPSIIIS